MATELDTKQEEHKLTDEIRLKLNFDLSDRDIEETKEIYGNQCNGLKHKEEQKDLWKCLAIARKNKLPLLPLIVDSFTRDRIDYFLKNNKPLPLQDWSLQYPTLKGLSKEKKHQEMIKAAVSTFFHRYSAMVQLPFIEKYDDSIKEFTNYIVEAASFINTMLDRDGINPPFQVDLMIIPQKVVVTDDGDDSDDSDDDDDDFDDDDSDDDDDDDSENDKKDKYDPYSEIGDIGTRLKQNKIIYEHKSLSHGFRPRVFHELLGNLKAKTKTKTKTKSKAKAKSMDIDPFTMPHGQRLCIVVDRRKGIDGSKPNEIFMYKPDILSDFPQDHVSEWCFESSFACVIPGKHQNERITAKTAAKGYVFCLSFQIEERDLMKCYLYTRSQIIRFLPNDIHNVLPLLFVVEDGDDNHDFVQNEKKFGSETKRIKLMDIQFEKFRKQTNQ